MMLRSAFLTFFFSTALFAQDSFSMTVIFAPRNQTILSTRVAEQVRSLPFKMGESFKKGDLLVQMEDAIFVAQKEHAKAEFDKAEELMASQQKLYEDNLLSLSDLRRAQSEWATAKYQLTVAERDLESCSLKAPYDGKVVSTLIDEYEMTTPGQTVIEIIDDSVLIGRTQVPVERLSSLSKGKILDIEVEENGLIVQGTITRVGSLSDAVSSAVRIDVEVDNNGGTLFAGMHGKVDVLLTEATHD